MNEVDSTNVQKEIETLAEANANGMTGFQEKFKVSDSFKQTICWKKYQNSLSIFNFIILEVG
jgi:hypothetical protein